MSSLERLTAANASKSYWLPKFNRFARSVASIYVLPGASISFCLSAEQPWDVLCVQFGLRTAPTPHTTTRRRTVYFSIHFNWSVGLVLFAMLTWIQNDGRVRFYYLIPDLAANKTLTIAHSADFRRQFSLHTTRRNWYCNTFFRTKSIQISDTTTLHSKVQVSNIGLSASSIASAK